MEFLKPEFCCFLSFLTHSKIVIKTIAKVTQENTTTITLFVPLMLSTEGLACNRVKQVMTDYLRLP